MTSRYQRGLSLVELMIALTIGMFLVLGVLYIYTSSRASYVANDGSARVQEDGRFALERLTREIRMAGYMGCANALDLNPRVIVDPDKDGNVAEHLTFASGEGIKIFNNADNGSGDVWTNPTTIQRVAGTDVVILKGLGSCTAPLTGNMGTDNANIQIGTNTCGWAAGDVLVISDCTSADIFAATNVSTGSVTIAHANSANTDTLDNTRSSKLSKPYGTDAIVGRYGETVFFVGIDTSITPNQPALYQISYNGLAYGAAQPVVGNVYDLQVTVNLDTDGDGDVDSSKQAVTNTTNWRQVLSLNVAYSVRSEDGAAGAITQTYTYNGASVTDRRIRRDFATVVGIRNRLP